MKRILIAGVLAGIAMFVWESVAHMLLPFGEMGISHLPNDAAMRAALAAQLGNADALFFYPTIQMDQTPSPGPWGLLLYHPQWSFSWAVMGWEALTELIQGVALALVVGMAAAGSFGKRFGIAVLVRILWQAWNDAEARHRLMLIYAVFSLYISIMAGFILPPLAAGPQ